MVSSVPYVMIGATNAPYKTVPELIAYAKANPGTLNFGVPNGAPPHMLAEMFKMQTGADIQVVPYKGASTLITDMIAGRIHGGFETTSVMLAHLHEGNIRGLAVLRNARIAELPNVPTMVESGVTGVEGSSWSGVLAPAGTSPAIIARLRADVIAALRSPDFAGKLKMMAADVPDMSAAEFGDFVGAEAKRIAAIMQAAGLKAQ
jgi:tripartite-type tricarboxylate transporter receptor subunit TctC